MRALKNIGDGAMKEKTVRRTGSAAVKSFSAWRTR